MTVNHYFLLIPFLFFAVLVLIRGKPLLKNLILVLFGTVIVSFLDFHFVKGSIQQFESLNYPHTIGLITQSAVRGTKSYILPPSLVPFPELVMAWTSNIFIR